MSWLAKITGNKIIKIAYLTGVHLFAVAGLVFIGMFFAIRFKLTNVSGNIDPISETIDGQYKQAEVLGAGITIASNMGNADINSIDEQIKRLTAAKEAKETIMCKLDSLSYSAPKNSLKIIETLKKIPSEKLESAMIGAVETRMGDLQNYQQAVKDCTEHYNSAQINLETIGNRVQNSNSQDIFWWPEQKEWSDVEASIVKNKDMIEKAATTAKIEPRLIVENLMVEQLRLFYSQRELYKKYFEPLKLLANSNKISLGVMAIKEDTARQVEEHLKDPNSPYYLGQENEHLLDYQEGENQDNTRYSRLTAYNQYYNYLYGAIYLKQMMQQWKNAGFDIDKRPEVVATLFNVGFPQSKPNANPKVGGSSVKIGEVNYTFGRLAYEFYFSGELNADFPPQW
ncbi:MAG TPA: hypothetical protein VF828_00650 [Patescibacteria group bacterium]